MINDPFFIEVCRPAGGCRTLELIPIYLEENNRYVATTNYRIYTGYAPDDHQYNSGDGLREQYFDNLEIMGDDNPL